jgi:hypothetical protein
MNSETKAKLYLFLLYSIILGGCIYGLYDIITKISKLHKEDNKKNTGKIFGLVIALLLVLIISLCFIALIIYLFLYNNINKNFFY